MAKWYPVDKTQKFYVCDRTKCEHCPKECRWTSDIRYAAYPHYDNFYKHDSGLFQRELKPDEIVRR